MLRPLYRPLVYLLVLVFLLTALPREAIQAHFTDSNPAPAAAPAPALTSPGGSPTVVSSPTPPAWVSGTTTPTAEASVTAAATATAPPTETVPPTATLASPTPLPTLTVPPDTNVEDQAIANERAGLLSRLQALPVITGTVIPGATGGRLDSPDGAFSLGLLPGTVPITDFVTIDLAARTFPPGDPRRPAARLHLRDHRHPRLRPPAADPVRHHRPPALACRSGCPRRRGRLRHPACLYV